MVKQKITEFTGISRLEVTFDTLDELLEAKFQYEVLKNSDLKKYDDIVDELDYNTDGEFKITHTVFSKFVLN